MDEANLLRLRVCPLCDVRVSGLEAARQHLQGRRHKEQVVRRKIAQRVEAQRRKQTGEGESAAPAEASTSEKGNVDDPIILDECGGEEEKSDTVALSVEMLTPTEVVGVSAFSIANGVRRITLSPLLRPQEQLLGKSEDEQAKHVAAAGQCPLCNSKITSLAMALQHVKGKRHMGKVAKTMSSDPAAVAKVRKCFQFAKIKLLGFCWRLREGGDRALGIFRLVFLQMLFFRKSVEEQRKELMTTMRCRLCEVNLPSSDAAALHLDGKRHLANLAKADPSKGAVHTAPNDVHKRSLVS